MTWTDQDTARLARVRRLYPTQSEAADALGIPQYQLSRYLSGTKKPASILAIDVLRERIALELSRNRKSTSLKPGKVAGT